MSRKNTQFQTVEVDKLTGRDGAAVPAATFSSPTLTSPTATGLASTSPSQLGMPTTEVTATGTFTPKAGIEVLNVNHATVAAATTIAAPVVGSFLIIANTSASGTAAHTVVLTAGDFDGAGGNTATLNAPEEALVVYGVSATRYVVVENIGTVGIA